MGNAPPIMPPILIAICLLAQAVSAVPFFQVPTFSLSELRSPFSLHTSQAFISTLSHHGILAVHGVPGLAATRTQAFQGVQDCASNNGMKAQEWSMVTLKDGTRRTTLEALDDHPLPKGLREHCGAETAEGMARLRSQVQGVNELFMRRFIGSVGADLEPVGHTLSVEDMMHGERLQHFHHYSRNSSSPSEARALDLHEDMGLYLAFVPALSGQSESQSGLSEDNSFLIESNGILQRARFGSPDTVVFMMGAGAARWFKAASPAAQPHATRHALQLQLGSRVWFGAMQLPPAQAAVLAGHDGKAVSLNDAVKQVTDSGSVPAGCGSSRRATAEAGECTPGQTRCWTKCVDNPACSNGTELVCTEAGFPGSQKQQIDLCDSTKTGFPLDPRGRAMNPQCKLSCVVPSVIPEQALGYCQGATDMYMTGFQWPPSGGTDFQCVMILIDYFTLDSRAKFAAGCFVTVLLGILLEAIVCFRRIASKWLLPQEPGRNVYYSIKLHGVSGLIYGAQLTVGYLLMLVVMTYSIPLFMCVIIGLVLGNIIFSVLMSRQTPVQKDVLEHSEELVDNADCSSYAQVSVPDGATPCCLNDLG